MANQEKQSRDALRSLSGRPTKVGVLKKTLAIKHRELADITQAGRAKQEDRGGVWQAFVKNRLDSRISLLLNIETNQDPQQFRLDYAKHKEVKDEYQLLLDVLDDPEKRTEKIQTEIAALNDEIKRLEQGGERSDQY